MAAFDPPSTEPEHIAVSKSKGIKIDWKDGHHSEYELRYLRDNCPCATCTGAHGERRRRGRARFSVPALQTVPEDAGGRAGGQLRGADRVE